MRLINWPVNRLKPKGGPAGYLFNLRDGLEQIGAEGYEFLPPAATAVTSNKFLQYVVPHRLKDVRRLRSLIALPQRYEEPTVDYGQYECIHFHSTEDLYLCRKALKDYDGKVLLTSHSPCVYYKELISRLDPKDVEKHTEELRLLETIDCYSFERADYVIFPCSEAEEPYFHTWNAYAGIRDERKLRYLPTGIRGCTIKVCRENIRNRYGIPTDAFVVCYVGRHNEIKGYSDLVEAAPEILADENTWVLVAGKPGVITAPNHPRWLEAGWTDDPHSIISAADVFVLPNRETYFDLVLLEVLSLGQVVLATRTGGNKYFESFKSSGIRLYSGKNELIDDLNQIRAVTISERAMWGAENKNVFESGFSLENFARSYTLLLDGICNRNDIRL